MQDIFSREIKMRRCICALNPHGWMHVSETVRIVRRMRSKLRDGNLMVVAFTMYPKQRLWFNTMQCTPAVLMNLIHSVTEFLFDVDLVRSPNDEMVFLDATGMSYWVSDLWLVITDPDNLCMRLRLDETVECSVPH